MSDLEKRVDALEKQAQLLRKVVHRYRRMGIVSGLVVASLFIVAATNRSVSEVFSHHTYQLESRQAFDSLTQEARDFRERASETQQAQGATKQIQTVETLQVQGIEVINSTGQVVVSIAADSGDNGLLSVFNSDSLRVVSLGVSRSAGFVGVGDSIGALGAAVTANIFGGQFAAFNALGLPVVSLRVSSLTGAGFLNLFSVEGPFPGSFVDGNGAFGIFNTDTEGQLAALLALNQGDRGDFVLGNEDGVNIVRAYADSTGGGRIEVRNAAGDTTWSSDDPPSSDSGGPTSSALPGDLDGDGDVDFSDFVIFAQNFGKKLSES